MDRYKWLLVEMDSRPNSTLADPLVNIELTEWEKKQFAIALDGEIYTMTPQRRNYIIQRLDSFVSDGGATYNAKLFTIEHVLPQTPAPDSEWMTLWPNETQRKYWLNRIANLVPLTRQRNSAAQNYDFATKKTKYFQTKNGTSSYTLTTQVISTNTWSPDVVAKRQEDLEEIFASKWDITPAPVPDSQEQVFQLAGRGGNASGFPVENDRFIVLKGSVIAPTVTTGFQQGYADLRSKLISDGIIANNTFTIDYAFSSVSAAAAVVLGRSANGRKEWVLLDGRTVAEMGR